MLKTLAKYMNKLMNMVIVRQCILKFTIKLFLSFGLFNQEIFHNYVIICILTNI